MTERDIHLAFQRDTGTYAPKIVDEDIKERHQIARWRDYAMWLEKKVVALQNDKDAAAELVRKLQGLKENMV